MIPTIPRDAYNAFPIVAKDIQDFADDSGRDSWRRFWETEYEELLVNLGRIAGVKGPVIYNPFGGADVHYPFSLSPDITDDFSQGSGVFGEPLSISDYLMAGRNEAFFEQWRQLQSFDKTQSLAIVNSRYGGMGGLIVSRLVDILDAKIYGLYYFRIQEDGSLYFLDRKEIEDSYGKLQRNSGDVVNTVVEFSHQGTRKRFWYMPYLIVDPHVPPEEIPHEAHSNFPILTQSLDFDTLLIKAANSWWNDCAHPPEIVRIALDPARKRNARVLADSNLDDPLAYGRHEPRPMWREGYEPGFVDLNRVPGVQRNRQMHFGYNSGINFGDGKDLITVQDPRIVTEIDKRKMSANIPGIRESMARGNRIFEEAEKDPE